MTIVCSKCFRDGDELVQSFIVSGSECARCGEAKENLVRVSTAPLEPIATTESCASYQPKAVDPPTT